MADLEAMMGEEREAIMSALRDVSAMVARGEIHALILSGLRRDGQMAVLCGSPYNSTTAFMVREFLDTNMKCECGVPGCATDLTRISVIQILDAYIDGDNAPQKPGN